MAEVKQTFLKSKMNKDLDDRLVPKGEYRHAQNISVAKSEGQDVGALENILGNNLISNFTLPTDTYSVEIIGHFMDVRNNRIIVFMTNYVDTSSDALSNFSPAGAYHAIGVYNITSAVSTISVTGRFLNFSKTHEIYGVNMIDDLLFWTDNRNQPRKINLSNWENVSYYTTEDTISVSKYYPYQTIDLIRDEIIVAGIDIPGSGYTAPAYNISTINNVGTTGVGLTVNIISLGGGGSLGAITVNNQGYGYKTGDTVMVNNSPLTSNAQLLLQVEPSSTMHDVTSDFLPDGTTNNPYRQPTGSISPITWPGDPEYLKEKFVRFSYRFKFDDGEYSLIAPFTQTCFIPEQDGYFIGDDDKKTYKSTEVEFMQNKINDITLMISSPTGAWNDINDSMKIEEVDILYKESGQNNIKIVDTITSDQLSLVNSPLLAYDYISSKPWKTLPDREILRVHDQVPVRALAQEVAGDRVIYGNYINKPTPPSSINYSLNVDEKDVNTQIEYQNQNLKQNRTYQAGVVLSDRYGRQSTVILSILDDSAIGDNIKGSTIFHKFKEYPFSDFSSIGTVPTQLFESGVAPSTPGNVWDGDNLEMTFWDTISSTKNSITGEPGLYDATTNPLGWYSYKIVVKQVEQDYYNIYLPGILNGYIDGESSGTPATADEPVCHFVLAGDNINKVPRDLSLVGPNQTIFRTGRPSVKEDPSYYQFVNSSGENFVVDPFSKEGEKLLKERDRERDLDSGSQITNASVKLSLRLNNTGPYLTLPTDYTTTRQAYPGTNLDVVTTIGTGQELGLWDASAVSPYNTANVFYGYKNNPYIAKANVSNPTGTGLIGPHPNTQHQSWKITAIGGVGAGYVAGSKNIPCKINSTDPIIGGFKVNIEAASGNVTAMSIADIGTGWSEIITHTAITGNIITGAGDGTETFTITPVNTVPSPPGELAPSLAVYETQPLKSKLDIYWETSSNGLISELNTGVQSGDLTTPVSLLGVGSVPIPYDHNESMNTGTDITGPIYAINASGANLPIIAGDHVTASLTSVLDGNGTERRGEFTLEDGPAGHPNAFLIKTNSYFVCNSDNHLKGSFTFYVNIKTPGATFTTDGIYINRVLEFSGNLSNIAPIFSATGPLPGIAGYPPINVPSSPTPYVLPYTFTATNGSFVTGGLEHEDLKFSLVDDYGGLFSINQTYPGGVQISANPGGVIGLSYNLILYVNDMGGFGLNDIWEGATGLTLIQVKYV